MNRPRPTRLHAALRGEARVGMRWVPLSAARPPIAPRAGSRFGGLQAPI